MNDTVKIKSGQLGNRTAMPKLLEDELGYQTEEKTLYIGTPNGNEKLCSADQERRITALEDMPEPSAVFYATYTVTKPEDITVAYNAGKAIACRLGNGRVLWLVSSWGASNGFTFASVDFDNGNVIKLNVSDNGWESIVTLSIVTKEYVQELIDTINARLDSLENQNE